MISILGELISTIFVGIITFGYVIVIGIPILGLVIGFLVTFKKLNCEINLGQSEQNSIRT